MSYMVSSRMAEGSYDRAMYDNSFLSYYMHVSKRGRTAAY
jgi:hypothetical protein